MVTTLIWRVGIIKSFEIGLKSACIGHFSGRFLFDWLQIGYIFADFCSQLSFWLLHQAVELLGYLHLLVGIKVAVGIHRGLNLFVAEG